MKQNSSTRLVLICGLPASGKTTLARQLAPKIPAIRLDKDQWTTQLGLDVWDDEFRVRLERQLWALTQELLAQDQSVIFPAVDPSKGMGCTLAICLQVGILRFDDA